MTATTPQVATGWKLISFNSNDRSFEDPYKYLGPPDEFGEPEVLTAGLRKKLEVGTAFILSHYEHSGRLWFIKGTKSPPDMQFDGARIAGLLLWQLPSRKLKAKTYADRETAAAEFLEKYTDWVNGYGKKP